MIARRKLLRASLGLVAAAPLVPRPAMAQANSAITAPIAALDNGLLTVMRAGQATPFPQRFATLQPVIVRTFDLPAILRLSVGLKWDELPPPQRDQLLSVFRNYTVASYVANFNSYNGERFEIMPNVRSSGEDRIVATQIIPASGAPTRLDYVMRQGDAGWQAVDVLLDGSISRVAVQRSDFRSLIGSNNATGLIASLQKKVVDLSGGTLR